MPSGPHVRPYTSPAPLRSIFQPIIVKEFEGFVREGEGRRRVTTETLRKERKAGRTKGEEKGGMEGQGKEGEIGVLLPSLMVPPYAKKSLNEGDAAGDGGKEDGGKEAGKEAGKEEKKEGAKDGGKGGAKEATSTPVRVVNRGYGTGEKVEEKGGEYADEDAWVRARSIHFRGSAATDMLHFLPSSTPPTAPTAPVGSDTKGATGETGETAAKREKREKRENSKRKGRLIRQSSPLSPEELAALAPPTPLALSGQLRRLGGNLATPEIPEKTRHTINGPSDSNNKPIMAAEKEGCGKGGTNGETTAASILQALEDGGEVMVGVKVEDENGVMRNVHYSVPIDQHTTLAEVRRRDETEKGRRGTKRRRGEEKKRGRKV